MNLDTHAEPTLLVPNLCDKEVTKTDIKPDSHLKSLSSYQQELKKFLPEEVFHRNPARLGYFFSFLAINVSLIAIVMTMNPAWYVKLLIAFAIGQLNTSLGFFAHETLHGSIVKSRFFQDVIGTIALTPFFVSPTYWRFWHNTLHHGNTQLIYKDPDAFPTLSVYKRSKFMRFVFDLSPGSKNPVSYFYFFYWFSFQSIINHSYMRFKNKMWANMDHAKVTREFIFILVALGSYVYFVGSENFLWLVLIPFLVQNYSILSYISTNHNISPLTKVNDPLENSLTVTTNKFQEFFHLNFGYHVEHHLFPRVSCAHSKKIHKLLVEKYPTKYKYMPKWKALKYLYQTPRIYKNNTELIHPKTLETHSTI